MMSPVESSDLIGNLQDLADAGFDRWLDNSWAIDRRVISKRRNLFRLLSITRSIGFKEGNKFVYTCKYGWIDHGHYFNSAAGVYLMSQGVGEYMARIYAYLMGYSTELSQWYGQFWDLLGDYSSAFSPEDMISNKLGRDMGALMYQHDPNLMIPSIGTRIPSSRFFDISSYWRLLLKNSGAVAWDNYGFVQSILKEDAKEFFDNQVHNVMTSSQSSDYYNKSKAKKCLCNGDKAKRQFAF